MFKSLPIAKLYSKALKERIIFEIQLIRWCRSNQKIIGGE